MVEEYSRPPTLEAAVADLSAHPLSSVLSGGTFLLAGYAFGSQIVRNPKAFLAAGDSRAAGSPQALPVRVVDVGKLLPASVARSGGVLTVGSLCTFQKLMESADTPAVLRYAASSMANRNIRNRATVGGNIAANKSCASLIPLFLALDAEVEYAVPGNLHAGAPLSAWLEKPAGILLSVRMEIGTSRLAASLRSRRTACDLATATVAVVYRTENGTVRDLRIALGGFGPASRRFPELEALFEGKALPSRGEIEGAALPFLHAVADQRGSAEFKNYRGAVLLADALHRAEALS